jgi:hypothetical protein
MSDARTWIEDLLDEFKEIEKEIAEGKVEVPTLEFVTVPVDLEEMYPVKVTETYMDMLKYATRGYKMSEEFIQRVKPLLEEEMRKLREDNKTPA